MSLLEKKNRNHHYWLMDPRKTKKVAQNGFKGYQANIVRITSLLIMNQDSFPYSVRHSSLTSYCSLIPWLLVYVYIYIYIYIYICIYVWFFCVCIIGNHLVDPHVGPYTRCSHGFHVHLTPHVPQLLRKTLLTNTAQ